LWVYVPLNTKYLISETFPQANLLAWYKKNLKPSIHQLKKCTTIPNKHKKVKPGVVVFYEIWPGNGASLFSKEKISKGGDK